MTLNDIKPKKLNNHVTYHHFKRETLHSITDVMRPDCFMASLDIKDAYCSLTIAKGHRKYSRLLKRLLVLQNFSTERKSGYMYINVKN